MQHFVRNFPHGRGMETFRHAAQQEHREDRGAGGRIASLPRAARFAAPMNGDARARASAPKDLRVARLRHPLALLAALAAVALVLPAVASASPEAVIRDCSKDEKLDGTYSKADLRNARDHLPSDLVEYSSCREVIGAAIGSSGGGRDTAAAAASQGTPSDAENTARAGDRAELDSMAADHGDPGAIDVGGDRVTRGSDGLFDVASASNGMPLPLILALVGLALLTLAGSFVALRSRIPLLARISLPSRVRFPRFRR